MDPRSHHWTEPGPGRHPQRPREREDYHRPAHPHQGTGIGNYPPAPNAGDAITGHYPPPPDPRERERQWSRQDPRYRGYLTSPPPPRPPPEFSLSSYSTTHSRTAYGRPHSTMGYIRPEPQHSRPHSRQAYDYPPQIYWDHSQDYGYYDQGYYKGHYPDAGQWAPQEQWRSDPYQERRYEQDQTGSGYPEQQRYDQRRASSQHDFRGSDEDRSKENEEAGGDACSYAAGALVISKASGLSSSSYELSQYINGAEQTDPAPQPTWSTADTEHAAIPQATAPLKYTLPHALVSFGPAGQLIRISPGLAMQGDPGKVELHSLEIILGETQEQQDMREFPGPLAREDLHKVDAISFAHQMAEACMKDEKLQDKGSAALLWNLLVLLCRQNGRIVGSDIAELLMRNSQGHGGSGGSESEAPTLIDLSEGPSPETDPLDGADLLTGTATSVCTPESTEKDMQGYTKLLLAGRKKEALELAMKRGLWGHALFLASKMDNRSYTTVLNRFTGQLAPSDPLQTLFQMLSGRIPAVSTCCGSDKWKDWEPHLAVMLSNETGDPITHQKSIITMGDTLASRGLSHAAHICYLTAYAPFGVYTAKTERLVLLGNCNSLPFKEFAQNSAIRCTELFEYCQRLGDKFFCIPPFQVYKFLYACRLLDAGLASQAFHYCEVIGMSLLRLQEPSMVLLGELIKLAERLKQCEGMGQLSDTADNRPGQEPDWLKQLRYRQQGIQMGSNGCSDTYQSPAEGSALAHEESRVYSESDTGDLSVRGDDQGPDAELFYHKAAEEQQQQHVQAQQINTQPPLPVMASNAQPAVPLVVGGHYSYHYTDTAQLQPQTSSQHPTLDCPPLEKEGGDPSAGPGMIGVHVNAGMMPVAEYSQQYGQEYGYGGQQAWQQGGHQATITQEGKASEPDKIQPKQSTKSGWFSSWFKHKPKEEQSEAPQDADSADPVPTMETPPTSLFSFPPPPTTNIPAANFPTQPASTGINPFSRKAGE
ncbi:protein transport protein Sec16B [Coregonus clupeaformis]|uniref:protein transport protein Sec16B n=1 Tax=Coregonus clupeaformis TaxID=59861 RepID=UPI001BE082BB|nr:protein transport protein Sec16B [Coregonus clupeaformis]XP_041696188.1 protein transport protein Sec16B [Coregonus clupeaformis]XP_041696189.1 protein transport protein Sec16B [Coregonus clupeaformis]XP_041696190.1 protein transport protein Sec16B [Coregonus clupeaformis]